MRKFFLKFKKRTQNEDGAVMILMVFLLVILLGFAALAFDYGMVYYKDSKLQTAVDIAARAAARQYADIKDIDASKMTDEQKQASIEETIIYYLEKNGFPQDELKVCNISADASGEISIDARADVDLNFARVFTDKPIPISAGTAAITEVEVIEGKKSAVDVVFVLDLSSSMFKYNKYQDRFVPMVKAVNGCIHSIVGGEEKEVKNRVGIVSYSNENIDSGNNFGKGESSVILHMTDSPLCSRHSGYTAGGVPNYMAFSSTLESGNPKSATKVGLYTAEGKNEYQWGGTYIQLGIAVGGKLMYDRAREDIDTGYERNVYRMPAVFIMTDGEATKGHNNWNTDDPNKMRTGVINYGSSDRKVAEISYNTLLTACYWKDKLSEIYTQRNGEETSCMVYTLGLDLNALDSKTRTQIATGLLNPQYFETPGEAWTSNARYFKNKLESMSNPYYGNKKYQYTDKYYEAVGPEQLAEMMDTFAADVVEPSKKYSTKLTR